MGLEEVASVKIPYLVEDVDRHGNVRLYYRRPGCQKVRIREKLGSEAFWSVYNGLQQNPPPPAPKVSEPVKGSLRWLCGLYYESAEFKRLDPKTRSVRKKTLEKLCLRDGDKAVALLEPKHIRKRRDAYAEKPGTANEVVKSFRKLFSWALEARHVDDDPAKDVPYIQTDSEGFHTWTVDEVRKFEERHPVGTKARLALSLLLFTGTRRSDMTRLGKEMINEGWLSFTEYKGRNRKPKLTEIPILPELEQAIKEGPVGDTTFLVTDYGKPFSHNGFSNWFRARCDEAGLPHCSAHGLRKAGATIAADNGATEHQLMAIFGWTTTKQSSFYTRKANRRKLANQGMRLLVPLSKAPVPPEEKV